MRRLLGLMVAAAVATGVYADTKLTLNATNTKVEFTGKKATGKHTGGFKKLTGTAEVGADPTALKLNVEIDIDSIHSDDAKLTSHLKGPDFFDVTKHPKSKFAITKVEKTADGHKVTGKLTMLGKEKEITFPAKVTQTADSLKLESTFKIKRDDYGMTYGKGMIENDVELKVTLDTTKK